LYGSIFDVWDKVCYEKRSGGSATPERFRSYYLCVCVLSSAPPTA